MFQTTAHEARGPLIITRGGPGVLSDRPMGGLTAGGVLKGTRGRRLYPALLDVRPIWITKFAADGREGRDAFPT